ncbi:glycine zipper 2TM domain-containing protein [Burkholderia sp. Bp9143]|uniref:glycine zipper 2TM domain-containing protein n=1 Tax=Burkholderia sp. Bp9143 TaxID=2184574 RepID=UPI000F59A144|nr:glycine zipper 2TM domain-containing protein [Burkholderia sp. Bp9143]RQR28264.1 glycine zipper 2TM domain-containing protein [Burkholderia sp. Bp9143]
MDNQNQTTPQKQRLHPLIATAAGAVIVASLAATAAITGIFPKASSNNAQNGQTQAALIASQPAVDTSAAASAALAAQAQQQAAEQAAQQKLAAEKAAAAQAEPKPAPRPAATHHRHTPAPQPPQYAQQPSAPAQPAYCQTCGTVVAITQTRTPGQSSGIGAVGGAAAGGLLGNQFGHGNGRTAMTIIGALGGGLAGNQVEKQVRAETDYEVQVQMESGATRTFTYHNPPPFGQGQRVRVENGTLVGS